MYCWDTDVLSAAMRTQPPLDLIRRMADVDPNDQCTTAINIAELLYGAARRRSPSLIARIRDLVRPELRVIPFDRDAAEVFGPLRADLERAGRTLGEPDLRIAAIALSRDLMLVTGNVRHFRRVPGLRVENWLSE